LIIQSGSLEGKAADAKRRVFTNAKQGPSVRTTQKGESHEFRLKPPEFPLKLLETYFVAGGQLLSQRNPGLYSGGTKGAIGSNGARRKGPAT